MSIINEDLMEISLNKMKFYRNECLLNIDLLKQETNIKNSYKTQNTKNIEEFKNNLINNLKVVNSNFYDNILVLEKNLYKYRELKSKTEVIFKNIGDKNE